MLTLPTNPSCVVVNDSGGKDSTLMSHLIVEKYRGICPVILHHQLLPEAWPGTEDYVRETARRLGVQLVIEQAKYYGYQCQNCERRYISKRENKELCPECKTVSGKILAIIQGLMDLVEWREMYPDSSIRWCT